jgi:fluoroquinolone resistance protein
MAGFVISSLISITLIGISLITINCNYTFLQSWVPYCQYLGFTGKTFFDWLEIAIIPVTIVVGSYVHEQNSKRREEKNQESQKLIREQQELIQKKLQEDTEKERYSHSQFNDFIDFYTNLNINEEEFYKHSSILRYKIRMLVRTINYYWVDELIDFISSSGINTYVDDIFQDMKLEKITIDRASLSSNKFFTVEFIECGLKSANLGACEIKSTNFHNSNLTGTNFVKSRLFNAYFSNCNLTGSQFIFTEFYSSRIDDSLCTNAKFENSLILNTRFSASTTDCSNIFEKSSFANAQLEKTEFRNIRFKDVNLTQTTFKECKFIHCDFNKVTIDSTIFENCEFSKCIFEDTDFENKKYSFLSSKFIMETSISEKMLNNSYNVLVNNKNRKNSITTKSKNVTNTNSMPLIELKQKIEEEIKPENKALASIRRDGMQFYDDEKQYLMIEGMYNIIIKKNGNCVKSDLIDACKSVSKEISNSWANGIIKLLKASNALIYDNESRLYSIKDLNLSDIVRMHDEYLSAIFLSYNTKFDRKTQLKTGMF